MDLPLPFDAYAALGVSNTADSAEIKSAYRKLALITHPDKFPDEAIKKQKEDEFHRIRQAYEKVGDEDERKKYNAAVRMHAKFAEVQNLRASGPSASSRPHPVRRSATFAEYGGQASFTTGPSSGVNYEFRAPKPDYDDDLHISASHQYQKRSSTLNPHDKVRSSPREGTTSAERRARREGDKRRDEEHRRARDYKYAPMKPEDDRARFEEERRRRDRDQVERQRRAEDRLREDKRRDDARREDSRRESSRKDAARRDDEFRKAEESVREARSVRKKSSPVDSYYDSVDHHAKKVADQESSAKAHISRMSGHRSSDEDRPRAERSSSSREHAQVRRSRASAKESGRSSGRKGSSDRERKLSLHPEVSAPPRVSTHSRGHPEPKRSYTTQTDYDSHRQDPEPRPGVLPRIHTEPIAPTISSRREKTSSSRLRDDSGYSSPGTPEAPLFVPPPPPSASTKTYYKPTPDGVKLVDPTTHKYNTVIREPDRYRDHSPEALRSSSRDRDRDPSRRDPTARYPTSAPRFANPSYSYPEPPRPSLSTDPRRSSTRESPTLPSPRRDRSRDRRRDRTPERRSHEDYRRTPLYREHVPDYPASAKSTYKYQVPPETVAYAPPLGDVNVHPVYSPYEKDGRGQHFAPKPHMYRSQTTFG